MTDSEAYWVFRLLGLPIILPDSLLSEVCALLWEYPEDYFDFWQGAPC